MWGSHLVIAQISWKTVLFLKNGITLFLCMYMYIMYSKLNLAPRYYILWKSEKYLYGTQVRSWIHLFIYPFDKYRLCITHWAKIFDNLFSMKSWKKSRWCYFFSSYSTSVYNSFGMACGFLKAGAMTQPSG